MRFAKCKRKRIWIPVCVICLFAAGWFRYVSDFYRSDVTLAEYQSTGGNVAVSEIKDGIFLDGPGTTRALILYPGGKVEYTAYLPLCGRFAASGIDVFLLKMPCNLAIFGQNKADEILASYRYDEWYLAGHSLGGAMAASYAAGHPDRLNGVILLAAYPTKSLQADDLAVLSVYGSEDGIVNREKIKKGRALMPDDYTELVIEGGNHARFGNYGEQKGDGAATIDRETQQTETVEAALRMMGSAP